MKKIIVCNWLSLDGFFAGRGGETDWFFWNDEIERFQLEQQNGVELMLFGRTTYDIMASYWPSTAAINENAHITDFMNNTKKIVFSNTLKSIRWKNSVLLKELKKDEIFKLKEAVAGDIMIYGSGSIASQLINLDLVDELRLLINPIILGDGKTMFQHVHGRIAWQHTISKSFRNGVTLCIYNKQ